MKIPVPDFDEWVPGPAGVGPGLGAPATPGTLTVNGEVKGAPVTADQSEPEIKVAIRSI